ncbi:SBBP repeat-containing protein [Limnospira platensis CENA597]|uniref:SBBP repeat-containing protein n=1 Tax=Limnospira platensis TaxID=118562 RepID=UPI003D6E8E0F
MNNHTSNYMENSGATDREGSDPTVAGAPFDFAWANSIGGSGWDGGADIAVDHDGNVYVTGWFQGSIDINDDGNFDLISEDGISGFIVKFNQAGSLVWTETIGGSNSDSANGYAITVDHNGNIYATGSFGGSIDINGDGNFDLVSEEGISSFIIKFNQDGSLVWAETIGGDYSHTYAIAVDVDENVHVSGVFNGSADINGDGNFDLVSAGTFGNVDSYIAKFNSDGGLVWAQSIGGSNSDYNYGIAVDSDGNIYSLGDFQGSIDINGDGNFDLVSQPSLGGAYIVKFDGDGGLVWAESLPVDQIFEFGYGMTIDSDSNVYVAGHFFIPLPGLDYGAYLVKFNSDGGLVWAESLGGNFGYGLAVDPDDSVYVAGTFVDSLDINNNGIIDLVSEGKLDAYIAQFNGDGGLVWATNIGGIDNDYGNGIAIDNAGNLYVIGEFQGDIDVNGNGNFDLIFGENNDVYVIKFETNNPIESDPEPINPDDLNPITEPLPGFPNQFFGTDNADFIAGSMSDEILLGFKGDDFLLGEHGNNFLFGGQGNDTLVAGNGNNELWGDKGNDILYAGTQGIDTLRGGEGNDIFMLFPGDGYSVVADFQINQDLIILPGNASNYYLGNFPQGLTNATAIYERGTDQMVSILEGVTNVNLEDSNIFRFA